MIRIFAVMYLKIWVVVASLDCSGCQFKIKDGEYLYTINKADNETYTDYSWINATDHPIATKRDASEPPVISSSHEKLLSSRNLNNLTLKRHYEKENGNIEEEVFFCCASPHTDTLQSDVPSNTTPSVNHEVGQPGNWTAVAGGVALAVLAMGMGIIGLCWIRRKKNEVKELEPSFTLVANPPRIDV